MGFGICNRLIEQLSRSSPPDSIPTLEVRNYFLSDDEPYVEEPEACEGLTLILACRSSKRAEAARNKLLQAVDVVIAKRKGEGTFDSHAQEFFKNLDIVIHLVDLASVRSVLQFAEEISQQCVVGLFETSISAKFGCAVIRTSRTCSSLRGSFRGLDWIGSVLLFNF